MRGEGGVVKKTIGRILVETEELCILTHLTHVLELYRTKHIRIPTSTAKTAKSDKLNGSSNIDIVAII